MESKSLAKLMEIIRSKHDDTYMRVFGDENCTKMLSVAIGTQSTMVDDEWWECSPLAWWKWAGVPIEELAVTRQKLIDNGAIRYKHEDGIDWYRVRYENMIKILREADNE